MYVQQDLQEQIAGIHFRNDSLIHLRYLICFNSERAIFPVFGPQYVMRCAIWYRLYNFKNVKNSHRGVLILVKLQA